MLRSEGRARVNSQPGYQIQFQTSSGGRTVYGRRTLLFADEPGAREGVDITMLAARSPSIPNVDAVGSNGPAEAPVPLAAARHRAPVSGDGLVEFDDFARIDMRVGRIVEVEDFPEARRPAWKLRVDFGPEIGVRRSSAQIRNYKREELLDRLVIAVVNFPPRQIGPVRSEVLVARDLQRRRRAAAVARAARRARRSRRLMLAPASGSRCGGMTGRVRRTGRPSRSRRRHGRRRRTARSSLGRRLLGERGRVGGGRRRRRRRVSARAEA